MRTIPYAASQLVATLNTLAPVAIAIVFQNQRGNDVSRSRYCTCAKVGWCTKNGFTAVETSSSLGRIAVRTIQ